jgi:hypothetical protein
VKDAEKTACSLHVLRDANATKMRDARRVVANGRAVRDKTSEVPNTRHDENLG